MSKNLIVILFNLITINLIAQNETDHTFRAPVDIPMILSGTFGELRNNHFHAGIDIKTKGESGLKIYSIEDGYVSRIKVSPWGYGKALYIQHPNGYTSVYAHLSKYHGEIEKYVETEQYKKETFSIELFPQEDELIVKKGDIVGFSGNTGGSSAPHLHFELRKTHNQNPQNVLNFKFNIKDNIEPVIKEIKISPKGEKSQINKISQPRIFKAIGSKGNYVVQDPILVHGKISLGIYTHDLLNGAKNKNGVYSIELIIDDNRIYMHEMDEFSFNETGYINSHIDYAEHQLNKKRIHSCYIQPNNKLSIYNDVKDQGTFNVDSIHSGEFIVKDIHGNISKIKFTLQADSYTINRSPQKTRNPTRIFPYQLENIYQNNNIEIRIPARALYDTLNFEYKTSKKSLNNCFSLIHHIHNKSTALHKPYSIKIKNSVPKNLLDKAFIAELSEKDQIIYRGGKWKDGSLITKVKKFGKFLVSVDTIPPVIKPINLVPNGTMKSSSLRIYIKDDLSGIKYYKSKIDDKWILMEYNPKKNRLTHYFKKSITKGQHTLSIEVGDEKGNISTYNAIFKK